MAQFLFVLTILVGAIFVLTNYLLEKQKKMALESLYKYYCEILGRFNALPKELKEILAEYYKRLKTTLGETEVKYHSFRTAPDVLQYVSAKKAQGKDLERKIIEYKKKWDIYDKFLTDVGYVQLNIENLQKDIKRKTQDILIIFCEKNPDQNENAKILEEETEKIIKSLDSLYQKYDKMQKVRFQNFDEYELRELEQIQEQVMEDANRYYLLLNFYNKEISISLNSLSRKSVFYIKLKELLEGYQSGKNKMANLGEAAVSFKTFEKLEEGSKYRQDIFVTGKRVAEEITARYIIRMGSMENSYEERLSYDELIDLLVICKINPSGEEADENKVVYNFNLDDMNYILAHKEKQELLIKYVKDDDFIKRIPLEI